uniref:Poor homologous synapsis 1 PH domain-containing protein n=1 Tax=Aegilops tauschii TaxID=37682 RepID=M8B3L2_AEGTA
MVAVGAGDDGWARLTSRSDAAEGQGRRQEWEVEFARYFASPLRDTSTPPPPPPPGVRYVTSATDCRPGAWLPAATPAALRVSRSSHPSAAPVLTVSVVGVVFVRTVSLPFPSPLLICVAAWEEHFVSILNFSWPQLTCGGQCPGSGSRVVFIQKFALRFPQLGDMESFLNCVKECLGDTMDITSSGCDYICEDSSSRSEYIASNELPHSFEEPASDHRTEAPALCYHEEPDLSVSEPLFTSNIDNINSGFPLSFTEMLTNLSTETEHDAVDLHQLAETDHPQEVMYGGSDAEDLHQTDHPQEVVHAGSDAEDRHQLSGTDRPQEVFTQDTCHDVASNENTADKETDTSKSTKEIDTSKSTSDIMARIKTYMADESFHDMLSKLERVIDELGVDLSLYS